jgi:hypothetical protein
MYKITPKKMKNIVRFKHAAYICAAMLVFAALPGCAFRSADVFRDANMDFGAIRTVAVMPFANFSKDIQASERVRDVLVTDLMATGSVYVVPTGELSRGIISAGLANPTIPSIDEVIKLCRILKADALLTGSIREYGEVRSAGATAEVISLSLQTIEGQSGRIVWSASTTQGGIGLKDRMLGGGGRPINDTTEKAVQDVIGKLLN